MDTESGEGKQKLCPNLENHGVLTIEEGDIDKEGVIGCLKRMFDKEWNWELREMDEYRYTMRFPPNKKVEDIVMGDVIWFSLNKEGVMASLKVWDGEIKPIGRLIEAWVQVRGIPPKWCEWNVFQQVASSLGKLADIDWYSLLSNQFEMVRIKIKCKDPTRIPTQRVLEINDELFLLSYKVEEFEQVQKAKKKDDGGDEDDGDEDLDFDEDDLLGDENAEEKDNKKQPDNPSEKEQGSSSGGRSETPHAGNSTTSNRYKSSSRNGNKEVEKAWQSIMKNRNEVDGVSERNWDTQGCINLLRDMELE